MAKIQETVVIACAKETVWDCLKQPSHLELFHPFCKENTPLRWNDLEEKIDVLVYLNGLTYKRVFIAWNEERFTLIIHRKEKPIAKVTWWVHEHEKQTEVRIEIEPKANSFWLKLLYPFLVPLKLKPKLKEYLKSVLTGLKYYIENKQPTPRNLLGKHPWFSA